MKTIIIVVIAIIGFYLLTKKSKFTTANTDSSNSKGTDSSNSKGTDSSNSKGTNYSNNGTSIPSCDFNNEERVYPSGNIPGSYLGLNPSEKEMLLKKFIEYNGELPEYAKA